MKKLLKAICGVTGVILLGGYCAITVSAAELGRSRPQIVDNVRTSGSGKATGMQLALFAPAQIFPAEYDVYGFRLNLIYGVNQNLRGLDMGLVNQGRGLMEGLQLGGINLLGSLAGAQFGLYNSVDASEGGSFQMGVVNYAGDFMGAQFGAINYARNVSGAQIGVINICETTSGVQIGVINIISRSNFLVFCPLINAQF